MTAPSADPGALGPLPWQRATWELIDRLQVADRLPHALLLYGDSGIGKRRFADALARKLLCAQPVAGVACGHCKQCLLMVRGDHPDHFVLESAASGKAIPVDAVRALVDFAGATAQQGGWRVVVVDPAEAMTTAATNAFLKTLEEPGSRMVLMVISHRLSQVLPTLRSRCRLLRFAPPPPAEAVQWLAPAAGAAAEDWLAAAGGRPLRALELGGSGAFAQWQEFDRWLDAVAAGTLHPLPVAERCAALPWQDALPRLQWRVGGALRAQGAAGRVPAPSWFRFLDRLATATQWLLESPNINRRLLWEEILLDWQRISATGR